MTAQQSAFETVQMCLASDNVSSHYEPQQKIGVSANAFSDGFITVLFHTDACIDERFVYFAFKVLFSSKALKIKNEGQAIVFALKNLQSF